MSRITEHAVATTLCLTVFIVGLVGQSDAANLRRAKRAVQVQVLSPKEFAVRWTEGKLLDIDVNVKRGFSGGSIVDFKRNGTDEKELYFSRDDLNITKGDVIFYNGIFEDLKGPFGEGGNYIFDGVFTNSTRPKRHSTQQLAEDPESSTEHIQSRFGYHRRNWGKPPQHKRLHPLDYGYHRPRPHHHPQVHSPHNPLLCHRSGPWGYGYRMKFGERGPWDGHSEEEDFYGRQPDGKKPWNENNDEGKQDVGGEIKPDAVKPIYEYAGTDDEQPTRWGGDRNGTNTGSNQGSNAGSNPVNQGNGASGVATDESSVTTTTTKVPKIDIRFSEINDDE